MQSKTALDSIIKKSRVHLYKPIQIAEILYHCRVNSLNPLDVESYRNLSKKWRDEVSVRLVGRRSTSSQKFQDNLFEQNAMPPEFIKELSEFNIESEGVVEAYIYKALEARLSSVKGVRGYIDSATPESFNLAELVSLFQTTPGLRRSIDKMYEILVFALFSTIVRELKAQVVLELQNEDEEILSDFSYFISTVLGMTKDSPRLVSPASLYRVGVTNAADRGLDMWANFGPAIQVKHLTLTPQLVEDIVDGISADKIVIVCLDSEKEAITSLLSQVGWSSRIQGIVTIKDLSDWYELCLSSKYKENLGKTLFQDLGREFDSEFPVSNAIRPFLEERGYDSTILPQGWEIQI